MNPFQKLFQKNTYKYAVLTEYSCYRGGDMIGSSYRESVRLTKDGQVRLIIESAESHSEPVEITEYAVPKEVLTELSEVFVHYRMDRWHNRRFTDEFICDGENTGYSFRFDNGNEVRFSSQIYPAEYGDKLRKLHAIVTTASGKGEKLRTERRYRE